MTARHRGTLHAIDEAEVCGFGLPRADALVDVSVSGADTSEGHDLGTVVLRDVRHGNRVFVNVHANAECARLRPG